MMTNILFSNESEIIKLKQICDIIYINMNAFFYKYIYFTLERKIKMYNTLDKWSTILYSILDEQFYCKP